MRELIAVLVLAVSAATILLVVCIRIATKRQPPVQLAVKLFNCPDCCSYDYRIREDGLRYCVDCGWLELTPEQIAFQEQCRREYEVEKRYPTLTQEEFIEAWKFKHS